MKKTMSRQKLEVRKKNIDQFQAVPTKRSSLRAGPNVRIVLLRPWDAVEGLKSVTPEEYDFPAVMAANHVHVIQCLLRVNLHKILEKVKDSDC